MVLGKLDSHVQRNEMRALSHITHKDKLKMDERSKCETRFHQNPRGEHRQHLFELGHSNFLQNTAMKPRETKAEMSYWDFIKIKSSAQQKKQSTKLKDNLQNGRRYLQVKYQING